MRIAPVVEEGTLKAISNVTTTSLPTRVPTLLSCSVALITQMSPVPLVQSFQPPPEAGR